MKALILRPSPHRHALIATTNYDFTGGLQGNTAGLVSIEGDIEEIG
jgi:hypothetical protein